MIRPSNTTSQGLTCQEGRVYKLVNAEICVDSIMKREGMTVNRLGNFMKEKENSRDEWPVPELK